MTRLFIIFAIVALFLVGCVSLDEKSDIHLTPTQSYYATLRTYDAVLETAIAYKDGCFSRPAQLQEDCRKVVQIMRDVNREAQSVILYADVAVIDGEQELLQKATVDLERLRDRLRQEVLAQITAEAVDRKQVE